MMPWGSQTLQEKSVSNWYIEELNLVGQEKGNGFFPLNHFLQQCSDFFSLPSDDNLEELF
jgi:hypothetical protein